MQEVPPIPKLVRIILPNQFPAAPARNIPLLHEVILRARRRRQALQHQPKVRARWVLVHVDREVDVAQVDLRALRDARGRVGGERREDGCSGTTQMGPHGEREARGGKREAGRRVARVAVVCPAPTEMHENWRRAREGGEDVGQHVCWLGMLNERVRGRRREYVQGAVRCHRLCDIRMRVQPRGRCVSVWEIWLHFVV